MYYKLKNIYNYLRYDLPYGIKNLIRWFPIIWKDRDYDWVYIMRNLKFKLQLTADNIEKQKRHKNYEDDVRYMRICIKLIDIVIEEKYEMEVFDNHRYSNDYTELLHEAISKQEKAKALLFKILNEKIRNWWN